MKTLIIYVSIHHGNTEKIAKAMAEVLNAKLVKPNEVNMNELSKYDLIGFGSGIYYGKHHKNLLRFADKLPILKDRKAFVFATSGVVNLLNIFHNILHRTINFQNPLRNKLSKKGFKIIGGFSCRGFDTIGPFKLIGGISKNRPNKEDLKKAIDFARELKRII